MHTLAGLPAFLLYFLVAVGLCVLFVALYMRATPYNEFDLIANKGNASAAIALGMSLLGFALALASAIFHSADIVECVIWGFVALLVQIAAFFLARIGQPDLSGRIARNELAGALWLGFVSLTAGVLSAACMSG